MKNRSFYSLSILFPLIAVTLIGCNTAPVSKYYTVSFDTDGGSVINPQIIKENNLITKPADPLKKGYSFSYWSYQDKEWNFAEDKITEDMTLSAQYEIVTYQITYFLDGGTLDGENPSSYTILDTVDSFPYSPVKEGYTFSYWEDQDGNIVSFVPKGSVGDLTLTAIYDANEYTLTFYDGFGHTFLTLTQDYGTEIKLTSLPTDPYYQFKAWDQLLPKTMPAKNMSFTATWESLYFNIEDQTLVNLKSPYVTEVLIPEYTPDNLPLLTIGDSAFYGSDITSVVIPDNITSVGDHAFASCDDLTSVIIPESVTTMKGYAFAYDSKLTIKCEAESQPSSWDSNWNSSSCLVIWGYQG